MKNCYDCNHCEVCRWIDEFKDKDVCDFYENGTPISDVLDKIRAKIVKRYTKCGIDDYDYASGLKHAMNVIDKYRKEHE